LIYGADLSTNLAEICHQELATSWKMEARTEPVATFGAFFRILANVFTEASRNFIFIFLF
jgi:hypothetical protein